MSLIVESRYRGRSCAGRAPSFVYILVLGNLDVCLDVYLDVWRNLSYTLQATLASSATISAQWRSTPRPRA